MRTERDRGPAFEIRRRVHAPREVWGETWSSAEVGTLFLDTETTGLAGGTGTTPFLIGLATVEEHAITVEQYFLRRLSGEPAMLEALRERLVRAETLVTFNGRRFDWPILEARFIMSRMPIDSPAEHADLMGTARRLWYRPLGTYRLTAIERHALGIERVEDVDAAKIPGMYLEYLHNGDAEPLEPVFAHNEQDVLCLVELQGRLRRWIEQGEDPPPPVDWEGLGVLRLRAEQEATALSALRRAMTVEDDPAARWRVATRIARVLRSRKRWDELLALWESEIGGRGAWRVRALIEAAKVYEHRLRQPGRALDALEEAAGIVEWLLIANDSSAPALDVHLRARMARIRKGGRRVVHDARGSDAQRESGNPAAYSSRPESASTNRAMPE
jgi:hypothetical protein